MNQNQNLNNNPYINNNQNQSINPNGLQNQNSFLSGVGGNDLLKGALIGAAATYILTNEDVQKKIFKSFAKLSELTTGGVEEMKERFEDAKAEVEAEREN